MSTDIQYIWGGEPAPLMPYTPAVKAGDWVFFSGQLATDFETGISVEGGGDGRNPYLDNHLELQSKVILDNLTTTLAAAGCDIATDVVRIYQWFTSEYPTMEEFAAGNTWPRITISPYLRTRDLYIKPPRPASTGMGIKELLVADSLIEVDLLAIPGGPSVGFETPEGVPSPLAGYSPAIRRGDWIFLAGEIPVDWMGDWMSERHMGELSGLAPEARVNPYLWYDSPIERQTDYTLAKLEKIAAAAGASSLQDNCVKATVYLSSPNDFAGMDREWRRWFPENPPARVVVPYMGLGGMGSRIEIAMKLLADDASISKETIETSDAVQPPWHEPQAVKAGDYLFFSTVIPTDERGSLPAEVQRNPGFPHYGLPAQMEMEYLLKNISAICEAAGTSLENICKRQCYHADFADFQISINEWARHFPDGKPASTTMRIGGPLQVPGAHVILDLTGYAPSA